MVRAVWFSGLVVLLAGCVANDRADFDGASRSRAPMLGAADSLDNADYGCQIVARQAARVASSPSFVERCDAENRCSWVWRMTADAADTALQNGFDPAVLYQGVDGQWYSASGKPTGGAESGYTRFGFDVWEHTLSPAHTSTTGLSRYELRAIPYLQHTDGRRLFDHNRVMESSSSYVLSRANAFSVLDDPRVCSANPVDAVIQFGADYSTTVLGELRGGHDVAVVFDQNRLAQCRGTHNGNPAWTLEAFLQAGQGTQSASLITFPSTFGIDADSIAARFELPTDADHIDVWFKNAAYSGSFCEAWDSNFGRNHRFDVTPLAAPDWVGNTTFTISRSASTPCDSGSALNGGFVFDTWARQRAAITSICTEIYAAGVTDRAGVGDVFDAAVEVRAKGTQTWETVPMKLDRAAGNNLRYHASLRDIDPFPSVGDHCPTVPFEVDGMSMHVDVELRFVVNGEVVGEPAQGRFSQTLFDDCL